MLILLMLVGTVGAYDIYNMTHCGDPLVFELRATNLTFFHGTIDPDIELQYVLLVMVFVVLVTSFASFMYTVVSDENTTDAMDSIFDAGGSFRSGLATSFIVAQWTWGPFILQAPEKIPSVGVSGAFWMATSASVHLLIFAYVAVELKEKAPGAKTFLQIVRARFGRTTHVTLLVLALCNSYMNIVMVVLSTSRVFGRLVNGLNEEMGMLMVSLVVCLYTVVGGLGANFYMSYVTTAVMMMCTIYMVSEIQNEHYNSTINYFKDTSIVKRLILCAGDPSGIYGPNLMTFLSIRSISYGAVKFLSSIGVLVLDQVYWQAAIATKPLHVAPAFIYAGLACVVIPMCMGTFMGVYFVSFSSAQGEAMLSDESMANGLIIPVVTRVMTRGNSELILVFFILISVLTTGSGEFIAFTSIFIYDIMECYLYPFRERMDRFHCVLCGQIIIDECVIPDLIDCSCKSSRNCKLCNQDNLRRSLSSKAVLPYHQCQIHKDFREYHEELLTYKNWIIVWAALGVVPVYVMVINLQVDIEEMFSFSIIIISSAAFPVGGIVIWPRLNSKAILSGTLGGSCCGLISCFAYMARAMGDDPTTIHLKSSREFFFMFGTATSCLSATVITVLVVFLTTKPMNSADIEDEWSKVRDIDNPILPWAEKFKMEFNVKFKFVLHEKPKTKKIRKIFHATKRWTLISAGVLIVFLLGVVPAMSCAYDFFWTVDLDKALGGMKVSLYVVTLFVLFKPILEEVAAFMSKIELQKLNENLMTVSSTSDGATATEIALGAFVPPRITKVQHKMTRTAKATIASKR